MACGAAVDCAQGGGGSLVVVYAKLSLRNNAGGQTSNLLLHPLAG